MVPQFVDVDAWEDWGVLDTWSRGGKWFAKGVVQATNPKDVSTPGWLIFTAEGCTSVEEAIARLERGIIETLAQGGQLVERRTGFGRRGYDRPGIDGTTYRGSYNPEFDRRR